MLFYRGNMAQSIRSCPFRARLPFMQIEIHYFASCAVSFRVTSWLFTILWLTYFFSPFFSSTASASEAVLIEAESDPPAISSSWCGYHYWCYAPSLGLLFFMVLGFLFPVVVSDLVLCARCVLLCRNSRLLHSCCVKWPFRYLLK